VKKYGIVKETCFYPVDTHLRWAYNPASRDDMLFIVFTILLFDIVFMKGCAGGGLAYLA
jgi:hypothetical protein